MILGTILTEKLMLNSKSIVASNQTLTLIVKKSCDPNGIIGHIPKQADLFP
jgi:hypothetical protein